MVQDYQRDYISSWGEHEHQQDASGKLNDIRGFTPMFS